MLHNSKRLWLHVEPFAATDRNSGLFLRTGLQEFWALQASRGLATGWQPRFHLFHRTFTLYNIH